MFRLTYLDSSAAVLHVDERVPAERVVTALLARDAVVPIGTDPAGFLSSALLQISPEGLDERIRLRPVAVQISGGRRVEVQWIDYAPDHDAAMDALTADLPRGVGSPLSAEDRAIIAAEEERLDCLESGAHAAQQPTRAAGQAQPDDMVRHTVSVLRSLGDDPTLYRLRYAHGIGAMLPDGVVSITTGTPAALLLHCLTASDGTTPRAGIRVLSIGQDGGAL